ILILGNTTDIYSSKVIRSSMGALFHMPFIKSDRFQDCQKYTSDFNKIGTFLDIESDFVSDEKEKKMIFLGNEANGLRNDLKNFIDCNYRIRSKSTFDSLNVSVAAGIILNNIFNYMEDIRCS
ncbi:MAG: RNA methyltransferase, partial [Candidatus Delongbacteria bacterium]